MTAVKITPTKLKGKVQVPPSKSLAHRAIICASLAKELVVLIILNIPKIFKRQLKQCNH